MTSKERIEASQDELSKLVQAVQGRKAEKNIWKGRDKKREGEEKIDSEIMSRFRKIVGK